MVDLENVLRVYPIGGMLFFNEIWKSDALREAIDEYHENPNPTGVTEIAINKDGWEFINTPHGIVHPEELMWISPNEDRLTDEEKKELGLI